jgi:hypothetical protein
MSMQRHGQNVKYSLVRRLRRGNRKLRDRKSCLSYIKEVNCVKTKNNPIDTKDKMTYNNIEVRIDDRLFKISKWR